MAATTSAYSTTASYEDADARDLYAGGSDVHDRDEEYKGYLGSSMDGTQKVVVRCPAGSAMGILKGPEKRAAKNDDPPDPVD